MRDRRQESFNVRVEAAELAKSRQYPTHQANGDEQTYAGEQYFMSFTKGLPHNPDTGLLQDPLDFVEYRRAIDDGFIDPFSDKVRHGAKFKVVGNEVVEETDTSLIQDFRQWEAPTAGVVFELEGADPQAVTMPPAPPLLGADREANPELALEMAEVYELAILRDKPLNSFEQGNIDPDIKNSIDRLNALSYIGNQTGRPRKVNSGGRLDFQNVFRGSSPGVEIGPYLSQFLLIGNTDLNGAGGIAQGKITYGVLQIDQQVPIAEPGKDFMIDLDTYVRVQRGLQPNQANVAERQTYVREDGTLAENIRPGRRFINTLRDLATYVHFDALYEAYLNACITLLGMGTPFDPAFDHLSGVGVAAANPATRRNAGGFALYGGPHILTLVTEVATRALKAVRFQKFNNHIRLRPEALAARIELLRNPSGNNIPPMLSRDIGKLKAILDSNQARGGQSTLAAIAGGPGNRTNFLPMAFAEGSPMHPSYGAGHAAVAGACVTILKAFFDTSAVLASSSNRTAFKRFAPGDVAIAFRAPQDDPNREILDRNEIGEFLTLEGELNKLAANISIARNMAGVHYFSDYFDSLRLGEEIALSILEEQALTYSTDPFVLSVPTFDGEVVRIGRR